MHQAREYLEVLGYLARLLALDTQIWQDVTCCKTKRKLTNTVVPEAEAGQRLPEHKRMEVASDACIECL
jgi:hypothetical protein